MHKCKNKQICATFLTKNKCIKCKHLCKNECIRAKNVQNKCINKRKLKCINAKNKCKNECINKYFHPSIHKEYIQLKMNRNKTLLLLQLSNMQCLASRSRGSSPEVQEEFESIAFVLIASLLICAKCWWPFGENDVLICSEGAGRDGGCDLSCRMWLLLRL